MSMSKQEANTLVSDKLKEAHALIAECETLADEHGLEFDWDLSYGMGGNYVGAKSEDWYEDEWGDRKEGEGYWASSSQSC